MLRIRRIEGLVLRVPAELVRDPIYQDQGHRGLACARRENDRKSLSRRLTC